MNFAERYRQLAERHPALKLLAGQSTRHGLLAGLDQAVISLTNFVASVYLARQVTPTEFGVFAVGFLLLHMVRALQEGLIVQPLNGLGAAMPVVAFRRYASSAGLLQLLFSGILAIGTAAAGHILTLLGNDTLGPTLFALWFAFLVWPPQEFLRRAFYARGRVWAAVVNTVIASLVRLAVLIWWGGQDSLQGTSGMHAIAWGSLAALLPGVWQAREFWTSARIHLKQAMLLNWRNGRWVLGSSFANWMALEVYPILTAGMLSFAAAGAYRALQTPVGPVNMILRATDTFLTPAAARIYHHRGKQRYLHALRLVYLLGGILIGALLVAAVLFATPILRFLYGDIYLEFSQGMLLMAIYYGLWFLYWPLQSAFKAINITRPIFLANLVAILSMFSVGVWAIQTWGLFGTIGGQALNALITGLILWAAWRRTVSGLAGPKTNPGTGNAPVPIRLPAQPKDQQDSYGDKL